MADRCEVTILVDNYLDIFLPSGEKAVYPIAGRGSQLWAEQGLSLFVEVFQGKKSLKILYDFGRSTQVLQHNIELLNIDIAKLDYMVLSHGHVDHFGSLAKMLDATLDRCRLIVHPDAFGRKRFIKIGEDNYAGPWEIEKQLIQIYDERIIKSTGMTDLGFGVHISGQIERTIEFERGMLNAFVDAGNGLMQDDIYDDQALFIEIIGLGTVVVTGCCHAGIVNTIIAAENKFPGKGIYAIIGGLHLNNADGPQIHNTIEELKSRNIQFLSVLHCTGYYASRQLMTEFRAAWVPGTVGAKLILGA